MKLWFQHYSSVRISSNKRNLKVIFFSNIPIPVRSYNGPPVLTFESLNLFCESINFSSKLETVTLAHLLILAIRHNFRKKNKINRFGDKLKNVDVWVFNAW